MSDAATPFAAAERQRASAIVAAARSAGWTIATAESCTGGLVAALLTDVPGSSAVLDRGFVTYSNGAKTELLGVPAALIAQHGAVSAEVADAMAEGARTRARVTCAVAITGVAGPGGGTNLKPVGLVHFGLALDGLPTRTLMRRFGDLGRSAVRLAAVREALSLIEDALSAAPVQAVP